jgi:CheY-like chemotaxis protein
MARILLIEDDPNAREMLRFRFKKAGYEVAEAIDGDEGLLKALRKPDLIFLDVRIPKIDGWELCRILKNEPRTRHIPIVMLTGCEQPAQAEYGKACGADAYLTKPWDPKELMIVARRFISQKPQKPGA